MFERIAWQSAPGVGFCDTICEALSFSLDFEHLALQRVASSGVLWSIFHRGESVYVTVLRSPTLTLEPLVYLRPAHLRLWARSPAWETLYLPMLDKAKVATEVLLSLYILAARLCLGSLSARESCTDQRFHDRSMEDAMSEGRWPLEDEAWLMCRT